MKEAQRDRNRRTKSTARPVGLVAVGGTVAKGAGEPALDRRKKSILGTVVYEYIATGEPVGSATLTQKYNLGISPATARAEMASLEEEGYLDQPHTSAGRVPSDRGYRYYVDYLMAPEALSAEEREHIQSDVRRASKQLSLAVDQASHLLSSLTKNIAFAMAPRLNSQVYRHIQLIWVAPKTIQVLLVTDLGLAAQLTVDLSEEVSPDQLTGASNNLNRQLAGRRLSDIAPERLPGLAREMQLPAELLASITNLFAEQSEADVEHKLFAGGAHNLLDQQEFRDLRKLRAILDLLEEQRTLYGILRDSLSSDGAKVSIGHELPNADMSECSVVTVPYRMGDRNVGAVGVLGPRRMHYARLIALMSCMAESLNVLFRGELAGESRS